MAMRPLLVAGSAVFLLFTGCAGTARDTVTSGQPRSLPVAGLPLALPAPSQLAGLGTRGREASYVEADLRKDGADFDPALPQQNAAVDVSGAVDLTPGWSPGDPFSGLAYCTYHFLAPDYDRNSEVRIGFVPPVPADGDTYLALANWDTDLWDWFAPTAGRVAPASLEPYFDFGGNLIAVCLVTGSTPTSIFAVRLGGLPPAAEIEADVTFGDAPLAVAFDASGSQAVEGEIVKYEWDTDGDGVFETDTTPDAFLNTAYDEGGVYEAALRITNTNNASATDSVTIEVVAPWQHTFGTAQLDYLSALVTDGSGSFYAAGAWPGLVGSLLLMRCDPLGRLEWARSFDSGSSEVVADMAVADNGDVILCGYIQVDSDQRALVQRWSPDGELLWNRHFGETFYNRAQRLVLDGDSIYVGGHYATTDPDAFVFLLRLDETGSRIWGRSWSSPRHDYLTDLAPRIGLTGYTGMILLSDSASDPNPNIRKAECDLSGADLGMHQLQDENEPKYDGQIIQTYNIFEGEVSNYVSGRIVVGGDPMMFLGKFNGSGAGAWGVAVNFDMNLNVNDMSFDSQGHMSVVGRVSTTNYEACLVQFDHVAGSFIKGVRLVNAGTTSANYVKPYRQGLLLCGEAPDATSEWFNLVGSPESHPYGFNPITYSTSTIIWNSQGTLGLVTDVTDDPVIDTGGGDSDALLMYRLIPQ